MLHQQEPCKETNIEQYVDQEERFNVDTVQIIDPRDYSSAFRFVVNVRTNEEPVILRDTIVEAGRPYVLNYFETDSCLLIKSYHYDIE